MSEKLRPYIFGALVGVLATVSALMTAQIVHKTHYLGASTTFVRAAGMIERVVANDHVAANEYFNHTKVKIDWQFMLVIGIFFGAFISSRLDKSFKWESVPPIFRERFGASVVVRAIFAFLGGVVALFGARLAGGCPSGHGLSGMMKLSASGLLALALFFTVGALVAQFVYRGGPQ